MTTRAHAFDEALRHRGEYGILTPRKRLKDDHSTGNRLEGWRVRAAPAGARGTFVGGLATIQCMYAPEFTAHSTAETVRVGNEKEK